MPLLNVSLQVSDAQLAIIDALRDKIDRDAFLCLCLELGIADFLDESVRVQKDYVFRALQGQTQEFHRARKLRRVTLPDAPAEAEEPELFSAVRNFNKAQ